VDAVGGGLLGTGISEVSAVSSLTAQIISNFCPEHQGSL
jgi:hypothetical protein